MKTYWAPLLLQSGQKYQHRFWMFYWPNLTEHPAVKEIQMFQLPFHKCLELMETVWAENIPIVTHQQTN